MMMTMSSNVQVNLNINRISMVMENFIFFVLSVTSQGISFLAGEFRKF